MGRAEGRTTPETSALRVQRPWGSKRAGRSSEESSDPGARGGKMPQRRLRALRSGQTRDHPHVPEEEAEGQRRAGTCPGSHGRARLQPPPSAPHPRDAASERLQGGGRSPQGAGDPACSLAPGGGAPEPAAASCGKEQRPSAESRGSDRLSGRSGLCLSLPTCKKDG